MLLIHDVAYTQRLRLALPPSREVVCSTGIKVHVDNDHVDGSKLDAVWANNKLNFPGYI